MRAYLFILMMGISIISRRDFDYLSKHVAGIFFDYHIKNMLIFRSITREVPIVPSHVEVDLDISG